MENDLLSDELEVKGTRWPLSAEPLRLWCHCHPEDAIWDAFAVCGMEASENAFGCSAFVVEDDLDELRMPVSLFRRLAEPHERSVMSPGGLTLTHCDAIDATRLASMLLSFAAEAMLKRCTPPPQDT